MRCLRGLDGHRWLGGTCWLLLQVFFSVHIERQLVEQPDYHLLCRWFVMLGRDDAVWNHAVFSKNRDRLLT